MEFETSKLEIPRTNSENESQEKNEITSAVLTAPKDKEIQTTAEIEEKLSLSAADLFNRIISSDLTIISVQKDAPDPSRAEKMEYLKCLFQEKPTQFLYRYLSCIKVR